MRMLNYVLAVSIIVMGGASLAYAGGSPTCVLPEKLLSWPAVNPVWEMCWLPPNQSVGADGSGMELRNVYWNGQLVMRRAHAPMLFAEYKGGNGGDCYRDWKDSPTGTLAAAVVQNQLGDIPAGGNPAITSCDRSTHPTNSYGGCPYGLPVAAGYNCASGVAIENMGDHVRLTAQYSADWYRYASRMDFYVDGRMVPSFGFGNSNGTFNEVTHWHHNYWRFEFDIDGIGNNVISIDNQDQSTEFSDLRNPTGGISGGPTTWSVRNATSGNGYRFEPGASDYGSVTNESGRGFHTVDFMATRLHPGEYADSPNNNLFDCEMDDNVLVNGESIANTNQALYYHVSVRDTSTNSWPNGCSGGNCLPQDSMVCKTAGPSLVPIGPWAEYIFVNGFDILVPGAKL